MEVCYACKLYFWVHKSARQTLIIGLSGMQFKFWLLIESEENSTEDDDDEVPEEAHEEAHQEGSPEDDEKEKAENETIGSEDKETNAAQDQGDLNEVEKEEEDDPSNLQLAWEMLELAKNILIKQAESLETVNAENQVVQTYS